MKTMTWLKIKFALGVSIAALIIGGAAKVAISQNSDGGDGSLIPLEIIKKSQDAYASLSSYSASETADSTLIGKSTFTVKLARPGFYRIEYNRYSSSTTNTVAVWNSGDGNFLLSHRATTSYSKYASREAAFLAASVMTRGSGSCVFISNTFFNKKIETDILKPDVFAKEVKAERIGGVDCYVLTANNPGHGSLSMKLWIGKKDFLIRQRQFVSSPEAVKADTSIVANLTETIEIISVNEPFAQQDFTYPVPAGIKLRQVN